MLLWILILPGLLYAQEQSQELAIEEVVVESERLVEEQGKVTIKSEGLPAEVNIVTKEDLKKTPYTGDFLDILRKVPGVTALRIPRGDIGPQIAMRGFQDFDVVAFYVDGMPMNYFHYAHGQSEVGWLVPEMIERVEVIKGPFSALYGNFCLGGVINIITKKSDPSPSLGVYGGSFETWRGVGVISDQSWSKSLGNVTPFLVWEGYSSDGYRDNNDYQRGQFFNKFTLPVWQGDISVRGHYVSRTWGDPESLSISKMKAGIVNREDAYNLADRGDSEMADLVINYSPKGGEQGLHASLYYCYMWLATGRTIPPKTESQQGRRDSCANYCGWRLFYDYRPLEQVSLIAGNELRYDTGRSSQWNALHYYTLLKPTHQFHFNQLSSGFFAQGQYRPFSFLKFVGGLRYDIFDIDVTNNLYPQNSGACSPSMWSPKIGLVITPFKDINIFANKGRGFRSPGIQELSPASNTQKANYDAGIAQLDTWDVGCNALLLNRVFLSFDYYNTLYQRELWLNPDTNTYENLGASKRTGCEIEAKIFLTKEFNIYGSWAHVRGRLKNPQTPGEFYISNLCPDITTIGFEYQKIWDGGNQLMGLDFYYLRYARKPVNASGSLIGSAYDRYMAKVTYQYKKYTLSLDAAFNPRKYASDYYWDLKNSDIGIMPKPQWEVLAGLRYQF